MDHITGLRILFPVYTFHFLSSSGVCSWKGLPAIWGLPVSESTIFKSQSPSDLWSWTTHVWGGVAFASSLPARGGRGKKARFVEILYICFPCIHIDAKLWKNKCLRDFFISALLSLHLTLYLRMSPIKSENTQNVQNVSIKFKQYLVSTQKVPKKYKKYIRS